MTCEVNCDNFELGPCHSNLLPNEGLSSLATRLSLKHPDAFLPAEVSEQLLSTLCEKKSLSDLTITLFDSKSTRLRYLCS